MEGQSISPVAGAVPHVPALAVERRDAELGAKASLRDRLFAELKEVSHGLEQLEADRDATQHAFAVAIHAIEVRKEALAQALTVFHEDEPDEDEPPQMQTPDQGITSGWRGAL